MDLALSQVEADLTEYALKYAGWISTGALPWKPSSGQNITDAAAKTPCVLQRHTPVIFPLSVKKQLNNNFTKDSVSNTVMPGLLPTARL